MLDHNFKILDCTLRDGGLTGKSGFSLKTAREIIKASCLAKVDYLEIGYSNNPSLIDPSHAAPLQFCTSETLNILLTGLDKDRPKIAIMQDAHKAIPADILKYKDLGIDLIRIATYNHDLDKAIILANNARSNGFQTSINLMAISTITQNELLTILNRLKTETDVDIIYLVDSYGALLPPDVEALFAVFKQFKSHFRIGVHFHNSLQLAFANTLQSISLGADIVDTTLLGIGRGAGNCPTELLIDLLKNKTYQLLPLLKIIQNKILPLRAKIKWGYHLPYMLAGNRNQHPGAAVSTLTEDSDLITFFNQLKDKRI